MTGDDIIAAISSYKKSKGNTTTDQKKVFDQRNSFQGKNVTAVDTTGHTFKVRMHVQQKIKYVILARKLVTLNEYVVNHPKAFLPSSSVHYKKLRTHKVSRRIYQN